MKIGTEAGFDEESVRKVVTDEKNIKHVFTTAQKWSNSGVSGECFFGKSLDSKEISVKTDQINLGPQFVELRIFDMGGKFFGMSVTFRCTSFFHEWPRCFLRRAGCRHFLQGL